MAISRYIVEKKPDQVKTALQGMTQIAKHLHAKVTFVVPTKRGWENTIFGQALGETFARALLKGEPVELVAGVPLALESAQTFRSTSASGVLVGIHISPDDMSKLDDALSADAIVFVALGDVEAQKWKNIWQPQTIGPTGTPPQVAQLEQPVIDALRALTDVINLGTGLNHPSDKQHAKNTITKLRRDGHIIDATAIRDWALHNNWSSGAAADLEKIARK